MAAGPDHWNLAPLGLCALIHISPGLRSARPGAIESRPFGAFAGGGAHFRGPEGGKIRVLGAEFLSKNLGFGSESGRFPGRRAPVFQYL